MPTRVVNVIPATLSDETRQKFKDSLAAFDRESNRRFGHPFKDVSEAQQNELLTAFSAHRLPHTNKQEAAWSR